MIFDTLLSGNDLFENLYGTFNNTGLLLFGGALLLGSGKLETKWRWFHFLDIIDDIIWPIGQFNSKDKDKFYDDRNTQQMILKK